MKTLHLLPNLLHEEGPFQFTPPHIDALIAESEKGGRRFLKAFSLPKIPTYLLNEHTVKLDDLLAIPEESVGLISDAGLPCLADPGALLVRGAREKGIAIKAYPGPSSIMLGLMLSGLPAQKFTFHGYLERDEKALQEQIRKFAPHMTHVFIEAPYRNERLLNILLKTLRPQSTLAIAKNLTAPSQEVIVKRVSDFPKSIPLDDQQAIFLVTT
jgi:16S rRNA (cytidine1402-2'-O)-methyltransferase